MTINWGQRPTLFMIKDVCILNQSIVNPILLKAQKRFIGRLSQFIDTWSDLEDANKRPLGIAGSQRIQSNHCLSAQPEPTASKPCVPS